jgi:hypothetical protein
MLEMLIAVATCSCSNVLVWRRWQAAMRGLGFDQSHNLPEIVNRYAAKTHKNEVGLALAYHALSVLAYHVAFTLYARPPRRFLACDARGRQEAWLLSRVSCASLSRAALCAVLLRSLAPSLSCSPWRRRMARQGVHVASLSGPPACRC